MASIITRMGETWDMISFRAFGDEHFIAEIMASNFDHRGTVRFRQGVELELPDVDRYEAESSLPPWKRRS